MDQNGLLRHGDDNLQRYTVNSNITANVTDWFKVSYSTKWTRENFERPSYLTGLFFHNIARRWPTCPAYDPNGYPMDGMEIIQLEDGGKQRNEKDLNTQQLQLIFEPIKNWTIHLEGALRTTNTRQHWEVLPVYAHDVDGNGMEVVPMQQVLPESMNIRIKKIITVLIFIRTISKNSIVAIILK